MSNKIKEFCDKCKTEVNKRLINDKRGRSYYSCSVCLETNSKKYRKKHWMKYLAQKANCRKKLNSEILTEDMLLHILYSQDCKCAISGVEFNINSKWDKPSLDRIDNSIGYTFENVQLVTWKINHSRGNLSITEFIDMCKLVSNNNVGVCGI